MSDVLHSQLDSCLVETRFTRFGERYRGKVRDTYKPTADQLILITTDRISAFDHIMKQPIPFKGQVLNRLAAFFFEQTADVVQNHILSVPDPNVTIGRLCTIFPIEFVIRGYLVGHAWRSYQTGSRSLCGVPLPDGLRQNQKLPHPILTPSTKAFEGHDVDISREEIIRNGSMDARVFDQVKDLAFALYARGSVMAKERGLILVDTKYEFGIDSEGNIRVVDEVHTPDSSRYFYSDTYAGLFAADQPQRQLSKEFLREWLMDNGFQGKEGQILPDLPAEFRVNVAARYIELFERVTGTSFVPDTHPNPQSRIQTVLSSLFSV